jgi:NADH-quinone oxidoreductase subunit L
MEHATPIDLIRWIVAAPLAGAILNGLFGRRMNRSGERLIAIIGCGSVAVSFALALAVVARLSRSPRVASSSITSLPGSGRRPRAADGARRSTAVGRDALVVDGRGPADPRLLRRLHARDGGFWRYFSYLNLFMFSMLLLFSGTTCCSCSSAGRAWGSAPIS